MEIKTKLIPIDFLPFIPHGYGNGYIGLPNTHPWYEKDYNDIDVNIHGGLTFSEPADKLDWKEIKPKHKGGWVVGFDCMHYGDTPLSCPKEYVQNETKSLIKQLNRYTPSTTL